MNRSNYPYWLLTIFTFIALVISVAVGDGMFLDGVTYASIARNLALDIGSSWNLAAADVFGNPFYSHPPLALWLQAVLFKIFGDHLWVERIYSILTGIATALIIAAIWNASLRERREYRQLNWLPVFLAFTIPLVFWSYQQNMLENTMQIFCAAAIYFQIRAQSTANWIVPILLSSLMIFLAIMSKGVVGLFPLVGPLLYWLAFRKGRKLHTAFTMFGFLGLGVVGMLVLLVQYPPAAEYLSDYYHNQIASGIAGEYRVGNKFLGYTIARTAMDLSQFIIIGSVLYFIFRKKGIGKSGFEGLGKEASFFFLVALAAILPLMISPKQQDWYLVPGLHYFGIGFAFLFAPGLRRLLPQGDSQQTGMRIFRIAMYLLIPAALIYSGTRWGVPKRDQDLLTTLYQTREFIPQRSFVNICPPPFNDLHQHSFFFRYNFVNIEKGETRHEWMLVHERCRDSVEATGHYELILESPGFNLFKYKEQLPSAAPSETDSIVIHSYPNFKFSHAP